MSTITTLPPLAQIIRHVPSPRPEARMYNLFETEQRELLEAYTLPKKQKGRIKNVQKSHETTSTVHQNEKGSQY